MESLGFSNPSSTWSDTPASPTTSPYVELKGRHVAPPPVPDTLADWQPEDFGGRLNGSNVRWSVIGLVLIVLGGLGALGFWLYQRPATQAAASATAAMARADNLSTVLPDLEAFNASLSTPTETPDPTTLFAVDAAARSLFEASGDLPAGDAGTRTAAASASGAALDGARLAGDARAYQLAVLPILVAPELETDPNLIELDEAARRFGDWQLLFDDVRNALPDGVMAATTEQLDILSGDFASILSAYVDALRTDDQAVTDDVLTGLGSRLDEIAEQMASSTSDVQQRVAARIEEARAALEQLSGS
ncbi:MAG: hypothetical protein WAL25_08890 [Acidimicrobiia bacterium]